MLIQLGTCSDPPNKIQKSPKFTASLECQLNMPDGCSIMNPHVRFVDVDVTSYNYAYIPDWRRYYYMKDISSFRNNCYDVSLKEDLLMSNRLDILNSKGELRRSADFRNYYLPDSHLPVTGRTLTWTEIFPNSPFTSDVPGVLVSVYGDK